MFYAPINVKSLLICLQMQQPDCNLLLQKIKYIELRVNQGQNNKYRKIKIVPDIKKKLIYVFTKCKYIIR